MKNVAILSWLYPLLSVFLLFYSHAKVGEVDLLKIDGGQTYPVAEWQFKVHPKYRKNAYYDVAVIFLEKSLGFYENIRPICLPNAPSSDPDLRKNYHAMITG